VDRDPEDVAAYDRELARVTIGGPQPLAGRIELAEYDPAWPALYAREERRLRSLLGERAVRVEHVGSTAVPGLPAKPIVDVALEVPDSADEAAYVPDLEAAGYALRIREPEWLEHRLVKGPDTNVNVHVFSAGCDEVERMLRAERTGAVGSCAGCGAPHSGGAAYCWQCGSELLQRVGAEAIARV